MLVLAESELSSVTMSSESSVVPCQGQGPHMESITPGPYHDFPDSPQLPTSMTHQIQRNMTTCTPQSLEQHNQHNQHHQWDINDIVLPMPEVHESFELWPSGHCRKVYRGDSDDARRHVSGWAMRNTNNHNALILKKSCLGVLVCSMDCLLDSGRKVHLRPAICDKARRKQIGKPCPNPGCSGKLDLLSCRGHCGYPVTHFWRHVNGSVYFQAKGYHDHPRPEVKSLSEKGRHAFSKQLKQEGSRLLPMSLKRRFPILTTDDIPDRKMFIPSQDDVMCSCPPFECVCPKSLSHNPIIHSSFGYLKDSPPHPFLSHRSPPNGGLSMEAMAPPAPFTQINITNTCLPPASLDVSIPGYDVYKNCSKFAYHAHCHDNDLKMFSFGGKDDTCNATSHGQTINRSPASEYRPSQMLGPNPHLAHNMSCSPRPFNAYPLNFASSYERDSIMRHRLSAVQNYCKSPGSDARSDSHGNPIKSEPQENTCLTTSPSSPNTQHTHEYHNELYQTISPAYQHQETSPRQADCLAKFGSPADDYNREQSHQEPTYITLTSPQRHVDEGQGQREFNSCRLSHVARSPNIMTSSLDNVIYPPPPTQPTRVDNVTTPPPNLNSAPISQRQTPHRDLSSQTRRSPAVLPHRHNAPTNETISFSGNPVRGNSLPTTYAPISTHQESPLTPFSVNSDPCLPGYPNGSSSLTSPYGYYCNDMFQTPAQQAYRNRSINITLTYN